MTHAAHPPALAHWHSLMQTRNASGLKDLLADEVVFHSPVVATPQVGKPITTAYLSAAMQVFGNDTLNTCAKWSTPTVQCLNLNW